MQGSLYVPTSSESTPISDLSPWPEGVLLLVAAFLLSQLWGSSRRCSVAIVGLFLLWTAVCATGCTTVPRTPIPYDLWGENPEVWVERFVDEVRDEEDEE